jgi:hypothetical protein
MMKLQEVLANMTDAQALACWRALGQWHDNEESRDDIEWDRSNADQGTLDAETLQPVVDALNGVIASLAD